MPQNLLGDYDSEQVTITLTGIKSGVEIVLQQFGPDARWDQAGRTHTSTLEGQGGAVIRNRLHPGMSTATAPLMPTDPACEILSKNLDIGEIYKLDIVDNNGTGYVSGKCWVQEEPPWRRAKEAAPLDWVFGVQIDKQNHGTMNLV